MIQKKQRGEIVIDLTGPEGNAFRLLAYARNFSRQLEMDWSSIEKEMTSGDYEHLVQVFDKHFGSVVTLLR